MIDQEKLNAARAVLGLEKRALAAEATEQVAKPVVKAGLVGLRRLLVSPGAVGADAGLQKVAQNIRLSRSFSTLPPPPAAQELRQLARHSINPAQLSFLPQLSGMRKGMNLE